MVRSLAARTREAARERPFLVEALAAGVVNYTAAARFLAPDIDGDPSEDAVATALRRFGEELERSTRDAPVRVSMESGVGLVEAPDGDWGVLSVGGVGVVPGEGDHTALVAEGEFEADALGSALARLSTAGVEAIAAGVAAGSLVMVVARRDGADALRVLEDALGSVAVVDGAE